MIELSSYPLSTWQILEIKGKFIVKNLTKVRIALEELERKRNINIAIDLGQTTQLDSSALTILINFKKRIDSCNGKLILIRPNTLIADMLSLVGFEKFIPIFDTFEEFRHTYALR